MLEIKNLSVTFNRGTLDEKKALQDVNLTIEDGDFVTIIGSNGAGKSTLLNAILGNVKKESGQIILDGKDITHLPTHKICKEVGILYQDPLKGTAPDLTIEENLALASSKVSHSPFSLALSKKTKQALKDEVKVLTIGLENRMTSQVGLLSGGQRQALTLLMATSASPKLLLLDEHTAALDPQTAQMIMALTQNIVSRDHLTTLMITHNIQNALDYGNKLLLMNNGKAILVDEKEKKNMTVNDVMALYKNDLADSMVLQQK